MNAAEKQLAGRVAAIEFILTQTLGIAAAQAGDREALFNVLRETFDQHAQTLSDDIRIYASQAADQVLSRAMRVAERWPARQ